MWLRMAMAMAMLEGRDHVLPSDLQRSAWMSWLTA